MTTTHLIRRLQVLSAASAAATVLASAGIGHAQTKEARQFMPSPPVSAPVFESVADAAAPAGSGGTFVANPFKSLEKPAERTDWPASSFYRWEIDGEPPAMCSATLIGSQTLATAAHCVPPNGRVSLTLGGNTVKSIGCAYSTSFAAPSESEDIDRCEKGGACPPSFDVALCLLETAPAVTALETITKDPAALKVNLRVMLTGFGCTKRDQSGGTVKGDRSGVFTLGWAAVSRLPVPANNNHYLLTTAALGIAPQAGAAPTATGSDVCPGDSGGGTYITGLNPQNLGFRRMIGINSAVRQVKDANGNSIVKGPSFIVPFSAAPIAQLLEDWSAKKLEVMTKWPKAKLASADTGICGLETKSALCR